MPGLIIFASCFSNADAITKQVQKVTGLNLISDSSLVERASRICGLDPAQINRVFIARDAACNPFTLEAEAAMAGLKQALAQALKESPCLITGFSGLLVPRYLKQMLRVGLTAPYEFRCTLARSRSGITMAEARDCITRDDQNRAAWMRQFVAGNPEWDDDLFDLVFHTDRQGTAQVIDDILNAMNRFGAQNPAPHDQALSDFALTARLESALVAKGHHVQVRVRQGAAQITLTREMVMQERLETEIEEIAMGIDGLLSAAVIGVNAPREVRTATPDALPPKILLVDDEKEFVRTLSERLKMRQMGSDVAFGATEALEKIKAGAPEVMVVDLKMPGMDGMALLKEVKIIAPGTQVIILTGHGSEQDKKDCMDLGAFAYFQKPVDIDVLSQALKNAAPPENGPAQAS